MHTRVVGIIRYIVHPYSFSILVTILFFLPLGVNELHGGIAKLVL